MLAARPATPACAASQLRNQNACRAPMQAQARVCLHTACVTVLAHRRARREVLMRAQASTDSDSRAVSIVMNLGRAYAQVQAPARHNITYTAAVQKFRSCCILAYECGYREEDVSLMFTELCDKGLSPVPASKVQLCMELSCIVWETIEQSASSVKRWSQAPVLTDETRARWKGFVALICNAYFEKRMASFPLDRLQLELRVAGRLEPDDTVAEWSRLVYETLNHIAPQFPKD